MSTFIDGIGQCQVIDKSGELVDLKGHDITSLPKSGTFTWEHQAGTPATLVGKILKAKKIFSKDDCENDRELRFWNKCKTPYLYVMGELLDDYTASAKECAGQMKYSRDNPDKTPLLGFSIEGSEIPNTRKGMVITRSIGRKVTLTQSPCNSMCIAEIYEVPEQESQVKDDFDEIFKSQEEAITMFKSGEGEKMYETFLAKKEAEGPSMGGRPPKSPYSEYENVGIRPGKNSSGETTHSHGNTRPYKFNPAEHQHAGEHHKHSIVTAQNPKLATNKAGRIELHSHATDSGARVDNRAALSLNEKRKVATEQGKQQVEKNIGLTKSGKEVFAKAEVDSYNFSPDEHKDAAEHHRHAAVTASNQKEVDHHLEQMKAHNRASIGKKMKKAEHCKHKSLKKDQFGYPDKPAGSAPDTTPPEPNKAAATSVSAGVNAGDVSLGQAASNIAHAFGFGKSEGANWSKGKVKGDTVHYHHPEHGVVSIQKQPSGEFHVKHNGALAGVGGVKGVFSNPKLAGSHAKKYMNAVSQKKVLANAPQNHSSPSMVGMNKAIEAGSYNAAPSTLVNGACYQTEGLSSQQTSTGAEEHTFQGTKKKDWKKRAKDDYDRWPHKERFEKFMKARMPHLADGEIRAIGRTLALKKSIDMEKSLEELVLGKSEKVD